MNQNSLMIVAQEKNKAHYARKTKGNLQLAYLHFQIQDLKIEGKI